MNLTNRDMLVYGAIGFGVWLSGALEFYYGGPYLFQSGPLVTAASAAFIAIAVCLIFRSTMRWRGTAHREGVTVAVLMGLPGLFGEAVRQLFFTRLTGLLPQTQPAFAATLFLGNAVLLTYAVWYARRNAS